MKGYILNQMSMNQRLLNEGEIKNHMIKKNDCCINRNVCIMLSISLCIVLVMITLTCINIYFIPSEDASS